MKRILIILSWILVAILCVVGIVLPFTDPSMTRTQLFLQYWWFYIPAAIFIIGFAWYISNQKDTK